MSACCSILTHFPVSPASTCGLMPSAENQSPAALERVVEVHTSGLSVQSGVAWQADHAVPASAEAFALVRWAAAACAAKSRDAGNSNSATALSPTHPAVALSSRTIRRKLERA